MSSKIEIKIFQVKCGACISINYQNENINYNIIIDSGYASTYHSTLKQEIKLLKEIDLCIITHTDNDHIGGMKSFISEYPNLPVKQFIYNYSPIDIEVNPKNESLKSIGQGIKLRDYLLKLSEVNKQAILIGDSFKIGELLNFKIISPSQKSFNKFIEDWQEEENQNWSKKSETFRDYDINIEDLVLEKFKEDKSLSNGSSLAFILEIKDFNMIFLGDSHPSVVVEGLKYWGYSSENKIKANFVKLSHHGSALSIKQELIDFIECENYIISTDGSKDDLPNKKAIASIISSRHPNNTNMIFNYKNSLLENIFTNKDKEAYNFNPIFPEEGEKFYKIQHNFHE